MKMRKLIYLLAIFPLLLGCSLSFRPQATGTPAPTAAPTLTAPSTDSPTVQATAPPTTPGSAIATATPTATETSQPATATAAATQTPQPAIATATLEPAQVEEAILILSPGPGSRLTGPIRISGMADATFEQSLAVRLVLDDGSELNIVPVQIAADLGERGPFEGEVPFTIAEQRQAFIQVFSTSARDGGITHLASVGVTIAPDGPENIVPVEPHPERIVIQHPAPGASISGGRVQVEGFGRASFEQNLVIEVYDEMGQIVGQQAVTVQSAEMGQYGPFSGEVSYNIQTAGAGRVVVRDPSPAFGGDVHLNSVEVRLEP